VCREALILGRRNRPRGSGTAEHTALLDAVLCAVHAGGEQGWKSAPGHGADHLLPALVSPSLTLPVLDGLVVLGTWQSVVLVDLNVDNPRRRVRFSFVAASGD